MVQIIVVSHGDFSKALLESAQLIVGEQEDVVTFGLHLGDSVDLLREQVAQAIEEAGKKGEVLVVTDIPSGSPFNVTASLIERYKFAHFTGISLPVFLEILMQRDEMSAQELVDMAVETSKTAAIDANKYIKEVIMG